MTDDPMFLRFPDDWFLDTATTVESITAIARMLNTPWGRSGRKKNQKDYSFSLSEIDDDSTN